MPLRGKQIKDAGSVAYGLVRERPRTRTNRETLAGARIPEPSSAAPEEA
jgi:hypothetical protein